MKNYNNIQQNLSSIIYHKMHITQKNKSPINIILVGSGIMSATLGTFLKILEPNWIINIYERLKKPAQESSNGWNNAGTGHSAFCELNYTTLKKDGSIDISKAIEINESFEISKQFWSYLIQKNILNNPQSFIKKIPHMSFVWNKHDIDFLRKRFNVLKNNNLFKDMIYSEDRQQIGKWIPLMTEGRNNKQKIAVTRMQMGTDINFGEITKQLFTSLNKYNNVHIYYNHHVSNITNYNNNWKAYIINNNTKKKITAVADYIFIGGGGASLNLLQTTGIKTINKYAGFPVGGQFLVTKKPEIVSRHTAKVYGRSSIDTPPMSVPHIDKRIIDGEQILLFGPFATFSSKFLKNGSYLDLFRSLNRHNIIPMIQAGYDNIKLIKYLIHQLTMSNKDRFNELRQFYPQANPKDWQLINAGQRVQIIKKSNKYQGKGTLKFGTEVISSQDGTLSSVLGASPGASTAVSISLKLLNIMFHKHIQTKSWQDILKQVLPSYNQKLNDNELLAKKICQYTANILHLNQQI